MPAPTIYDLLVGYYKFDAVDGNGDVVDSANQLAAGVMSNASLVVGGKLGNALRTSTSLGKMTVTDFLVHRQSPTNRISVNVWINLDKGLSTMWGNPVFCDKTGGGTSGYFLGVLTGGGNVVSFRVHNSAGTPYTASYTESATSGWVMITGVYEGSVVRIYRNGVSQNTAVADGSLRFAASDMVVGTGFEGLIDELSVWTRMLSSGDVTALYASGNALALNYPDQDIISLPVDVVGETTPDYTPGTLAISTVPSPLNTFGFPTTARYELFMEPMLSMIPTPYAIVDNPTRVFVDPLPVILSLTIDGNHHAFGSAEAGPTDAYQTYNYWEIELEAGVSIVVVDQAVSTNFFAARATQNDDWFVPEGSNWQNKRARFVIQAVEDSSQSWHSAWQNLIESPWNNTECPYPPPDVYADPVPQIVSVSVTNDRLVTAIGIAGPIASADMMYRWEIELPGGEVMAVGDETIDNVFENVRESVQSQFVVPDGQLWNGMRIRFTVRNEDSEKRHLPQSWSSAWLTLNDPNYNNPASPTLPPPPVWPYAINSAPDLPQIPPVGVDLYDVSRYTMVETTDLWPLASATDVTKTIVADTREPQVLIADAPAGLYRIQYVSGSRRDENLLLYNEFYPGAWKTLSRGLWIQSRKHTPWYVFQAPAFTDPGYSTALAASTAAAGYEFIFFHKGGDLSVVWDIPEANVGDFSGSITLRVRDVDASFIPGKWTIVSYEDGSPVLDNTGIQYPTLSGIGRGLTHVRYFLTSGDKKPRYQDFYIRNWARPGTSVDKGPVQNAGPHPTDLTGSGYSVKERREMYSTGPLDGNQGSSTQDDVGAE